MCGIKNILSTSSILALALPMGKLAENKTFYRLHC